MFALNPSTFTTIVNICIISMLCFVAYFTGNPLVVLGLSLLQQTPVIDPSVFINAQAEEVDEDNSRIGFHAKIEGKNQ